MALKSYGVMKGRVIGSRPGTGPSPHYQINVVAGSTQYRVAVNVKSQLAPSELLYLVVENFQHPLTVGLSELSHGFSEVPRRPGGIALDFIRGNLFQRTQMRPLPYSVPGPDNDLNEKLNAYVQRAIDDEDATIYAFGERWGPENDQRDRYFGFLPGNGIHDIHMNQGNVGRFTEQDGVWQDGGLLLHFPAMIGSGGELLFPEQWVGVFLAFQSQAWHTDDVTGHRLTPEQPTGEEPDGRIRIVAAMVNPKGDDAGRERVTLLNTTPDTIDLKGWSIADKNKRKTILASQELSPGATALVMLSNEGAQLSNDGGIITLLDKQGLKIDGVSYTREQVARQGWTIVF
ncbi:MAG: hypothetical protein AYP45_10395 [Candidatus Brocadia carolinensis]|uniref:LTD domain-containing protein n=1 Tax=Candidatus Brocadia carolinensis TaxID=1004156 RepID=A0A1V4AT01_9BACT|nr:MAG: hypothetical protein AYP45_10395 [Candidatus Brocadia caroliniensis]